MVLPFRIEYALTGKESPFMTAPEWISLKVLMGRWVYSEMAFRSSPSVTSGPGSGRCSLPWMLVVVSQEGRDGIECKGRTSHCPISLVWTWLKNSSTDWMHQ